MTMKDILTSEMMMCIYTCILGIVIGAGINANIPKKRSRRIYADNDMIKND